MRKRLRHNSVQKAAATQHALLALTPRIPAPACTHSREGNRIGVYHPMPYEGDSVPEREHEDEGSAAEHSDGGGEDEVPTSFKRRKFTLKYSIRDITSTRSPSPAPTFIVKGEEVEEDGVDTGPPGHTGSPLTDSILAMLENYEYVDDSICIPAASKSEPIALQRTPGSDELTRIPFPLQPYLFTESLSESKSLSTTRNMGKKADPPPSVPVPVPATTAALVAWPQSQPLPPTVLSLSVVMPAEGVTETNRNTAAAIAAAFSGSPRIPHPPVKYNIDTSKGGGTFQHSPNSSTEKSATIAANTIVHNQSNNNNTKQAIAVSAATHRRPASPNPATKPLAEERMKSASLMLFHALPHELPPEVQNYLRELAQGPDIAALLQILDDSPASPLSPHPVTRQPLQWNSRT